ncbi:glycoside hydrolase family 3 protein [Mucidula mucida]|nr:glycoside hydrolase family 3 protein [Mucidula mucida]
MRILSLLLAIALPFTACSRNEYPPIGRDARQPQMERDDFLDELVAEMTLPELVMQLHLMFGDNIVGPNSDNALYDHATQFAPGAALGVIHDWYPSEASYYNDLQALALQKSRLSVPFMQMGECLHGVGSYRQSMFPQAIGLGASWDTDLVYAVGRAIGSEARAIGIHACLAPVLDLGKDPRWGRVQEAWGEDFVLTSHMGVAFASGLSKNSSWADPDAVVPVMKHFAAHGSPHGGINAGSFMGHGTRQVLMEMLTPFKAVYELGGARGVMMAYSELDEVPAHVHPLLYDALEEWGYDGFITADDTGMKMLYVRHQVSSSPADTIQQWFNAGGQLQYYDYDLGTYMNASLDLVANGTVPESTLRSHARSILNVKYDLGLFDDPYVPSSIDYRSLTVQNLPLTLDAAHRSIVLLENKNATLPIKPVEQGIKKIALVGPFYDVLNYGDYSGPWGEYPVDNSSTIRQAVLGYLSEHNADVQLVSSWGADTRTIGTYFADTNFSEAVFARQEAPNRDWGCIPLQGFRRTTSASSGKASLPCQSMGRRTSYVGVAVYANNTARLYIDDELVAQSDMSLTGTVLGNIQQLSYVYANATAIPPGGAAWTWKKGAVHKVRLEFVAWNLWQKYENVNSVNAQVELFWGMVDREDAVAKASRHLSGIVRNAVNVARDADLIILAVGANWNSDGESGDRGTLGLSANQTLLADAIFDLGIPVVMVLQGGRPFAIPEYYAKSAATINAFFPGQSGGQAISDVLFGEFNPGGRVPLSVPYDVSQLPVYYNYKYTDHAKNYTDIYSYPTYSFGYGLSYTTFNVQEFNATSTCGARTFASGETITFRVSITNTGSVAGSYVTQVYLLVLKIVNRRYEWELETGDYVFALLEHGGPTAPTAMNVTLTCLG